MNMESKNKINISEDFKKRNFTLKSIIKVFEYSINGLRCYINDGKSIILYMLGLIFEIILGIIFKISVFEWIVIICILGVVLSVELLNTAIEATCDAITKEYNSLIKVAKDCGSAATFVMFIVSIILNLIIFLPKIIALF